MAFTYNDTTSTSLQGLVQHLKFISGQDSLSDYDAARLFNFAKDSYSYIALTSSGRWKFDDTTHEDSDSDKTYSIATATLNSGENSLPLATNFLMINQVQIEDSTGSFKVLHPIDVRDDKNNVLRTTYSAQGEPEYYDKDAHAIFFYPASSSSRTVKIMYSRAAKHFSVTDTTVDIGIPSIHNEYLVLHAARNLTFRTNDKAYAKIEKELQKWEGVDGVSGGKIRDYYSKRDQDTPRRMKGKIPGAFTGSSRRGRNITNNISGRNSY